MFELSNDQRSCFALVPVCEHWERIEVKPSPYDQFKTYLYLDGDTVVKCVLSGSVRYCEYELSERVTEDRKYLLPKTSKGKPVLLSSSNILKRNPVGMRLNYHKGYICLYNANTECNFFQNNYLNESVYNLEDFIKWVEKWCSDTTPEDQQEVLRFSRQKRRHIRYREGDVFRFKLGRRLYGYGRILLDYASMRKEKAGFWDILMGKPLVCSAYHIVTERRDVSVDELKNLPSLPSSIVADNSLFYGTFEIIGNIPVTDHEDYPIMYGNSIHVGEWAVCYQCGKDFRTIEGGTALYKGFTNNGVSFGFNLTLEVLMECVREGTNEPYWRLSLPFFVDRDLRNPKYAAILQDIKTQMGLIEG